jgi:dihydroorotate dehydrogenase (fumarate)
MRSLTTRYLGLELAHPIVPGASPLADDIDDVLRLEDAGAPAIGMRSIFEEQVALEQMAAYRYMEVPLGAESDGIFPTTDVFALGLDTYLEQLRRIRERTSLKVIASLNGVTPGGWTEYARRLEVAGAHALELNLYTVPSDARLSAADIEERQIATVRDVTGSVTIPVAVKLSPFYSSLPHFVQALEGAGARAVVLFNRFYQADIDPIRLQAERSLHLSTPEELLLRLRWLAIVSPQTRLDLAASGGVHGPLDAIKAIMAGAHVVQVVSALLKHGAPHLRALVEGLEKFLEIEEYPSVEAMRGNMNHARSPDPQAYERSDYIQLLSSWHGPGTTRV